MATNQIKPATIDEMVATAKYWRECARDEHDGFSSMRAIKTGVVMDYATAMSKGYIARAMELEMLIQKDMQLKTDRLKELHKVSTQGKTLPLFTAEEQAGGKKTTTSVPMEQRTATGKTIDDLKEKQIVVEKEPKVKLANKQVDPKKKSYALLQEVPMKEEQKDEIVKMWAETKGDKAKADLYEKIRDLMNYFSLSVGELRGEIGSFVHHHQTKVKKENAKVTLKDLEKQGFTTGLDKVKLDDLMKGEELLSDKTVYAVDDDFDILLLTGCKDMDSVSPTDYIKLRAIYLRVTNRESLALKELKDFYSTEKDPWTTEMAFLFLNAITREIKHDPLEQLVKNILVHKAIQGNPLEGVDNATKLLLAYSKHQLSVAIEFDEITKRPTKFEQRTRHWGAGKLTNFVNKCLESLYKDEILTRPVEPKKNKKSDEKPKGEASKEEDGSKANAKPNAPKSSAKPNADKNNPAKANGKNTPKGGNKPAAKKVATPPSKKGDDKKKKDGVSAPNKAPSTAGNAKKTEDKKPVVSKEDAKKVATPVANLKGTQKGKSNEEKEALKKAKAAAKAKAEEQGKTKMTVVSKDGKATPSNSPEKKTVKAEEKTGKAENKDGNKFQAIIYQNENSGKFGCYVKGFKDEVHVKNVNEAKRIPAIFARALQEYIKKAKKVNEKSKKGVAVKGRIFKMLPADLEMKNIEFHNVGVQAV